MAAMRTSPLALGPLLLTIIMITSLTVSVPRLTSSTPSSFYSASCFSSSSAPSVLRRRERRTPKSARLATGTLLAERQCGLLFNPRPSDGVRWAKKKHRGTSIVAAEVDTQPKVQDYQATHVFCMVRDGKEEEFADVSVLHSVTSLDEEPGVVRSDIVQNVGNPSQFVLIQVYADKASMIAHKTTDHYAKWRAKVADMLLIPSEELKMAIRFPMKPSNWYYPEDPEQNIHELTCRHFSIRTQPGMEREFREASILLARNAMLNDDVARFDILQHLDDSRQFMVLQIFKSPKGQLEFTSSNAFKSWMGKLSEIKEGDAGVGDFCNIFPSELSMWEYRSKLA